MAGESINPMKRVILAVMLAMPAVIPAVAAQPRNEMEQVAHVEIVPLGDWPLCRLGIQMPGCSQHQPELYMVMGSGTVVAVLESGEVVVKRVVDGEIVGFGGTVVRYTVR